MAANSTDFGETGSWIIINGSGGSFGDTHNPTSTFTGNPGHTYTLQWVITNLCDTTYDNVTVSFQTVPGQPCVDVPFFEYGGQTYNTVLIGTQCWMKENLNIGIMIYNGGGFANQNDNGIIEKFCVDNDTDYCNIYGGLYQWDEMMQYSTTNVQGICPEGWHVPSNTDWCSLILFLKPSAICFNPNTGYVSEIGGKMKETGTTHWSSPNTGASNESGFSALGAGDYLYGGSNTGVLEYCAFWSHTQYSATDSYRLFLVNHDANLYSSALEKNNSFSVRCIKD